MLNNSKYIKVNQSWQHQPCGVWMDPLLHWHSKAISIFCFIIIDCMFCKRLSLALSLHQIIKSCNNHEPRCTIVTVLPHKAHIKLCFAWRNVKASPCFSVELETFTLCKPPPGLTPVHRSGKTELFTLINETKRAPIWKWKMACVYLARFFFLVLFCFIYSIFR